MNQSSLAGLVLLAYEAVFFFFFLTQLWQVCTYGLFLAAQHPDNSEGLSEADPAVGGLSIWR